MKYDFDRVPDRRKTESIKWNFYPPDVLPMWVADMDIQSPQPVIDALQERAANGIFGYPQPPEGMREMLVGYLAEHYDWEVEPQEIFFLRGVVPGFLAAARALVEPHEGLLVQPPVYPPILQAPEGVGVQPRQNRLVQNEQGGYEIDWEDFRAVCRQDTRMFLLCNPHNPVGRVFTQDELARMAEICLENDIWIVSDEIHCDLVFEGARHIPIASLDPEIARRTITLMAPSKTYNLAGLKAAFAVIQDPALRRCFRTRGKLDHEWVNLLAMEAAQAAYREGGEWLEQVMAYLEENRALVDDFVRRELPGVSVTCPEGTYLAWLDCREAGIPGSPAEFFLEKGRVAFNEGATFGPGGEGFVRLNFGCPRSLLEEGLRRMKKALEEMLQPDQMEEKRTN